MGTALGIVAAWLGAGLFPVSVLCCVLVFVIELFVLILDFILRVCLAGVTTMR